MSKLIAISILKNEYENYLSEWFDNIEQYADYHIVVDDASDDKKTTEFIERKIKDGYNGELHKLETSLFNKNEVKLRSILWDFTRKYAEDGDWIIVVDADEFYNIKQINEFKFKYLYKNKIKRNGITVNCLDFWNDKHHFRVDGLWSPNNFNGRIFRFKDLPFVAEIPNISKLHQSALPYYMGNEKYYKSNLALLHYSYISKENQLKKYNFYKNNVNINSQFLMYKHALSIVEEKPILFRYPLFKKNYLRKIKKYFKYIIGNN